MVTRYYIWKEKVVNALGYTILGAAFFGFCYLYGRAVEKEYGNCQTIAMNPVILVCDNNKVETSTDLKVTTQRLLPFSKNINDVVNE